MEATIPYNGSGTFNRLYSWTVDAANNVNISSSRTDAELNGMAAALSNCITRDGQSPPSANLPMGGLKITNLGNATTATDALNMATADARYILSTVSSLTLSGSLTAATLSISGAASIGSSIGITGQATFGNSVVISTNNNPLYFKDANGGLPYFNCQSDNNFAFYGTDAGGTARLVWSVLMHSGSSAFNFAVSATGQTPTAGDNSTKLATTAFVATALGSYALTAGPTFTGTVTAANLTATGTITATGTVSTGSNANSIGYLGAPSNAQTASYTLVLSDMGKSIDFNGTSLTCTIPANASVAFQVGTVIVITNLNSTPLSIACSDTLTQSGTTTTGTRTLGQNGEARIRKVGSTSWLIGGTALS